MAGQPSSQRWGWVGQEASGPASLLGAPEGHAQQEGVHVEWDVPLHVHALLLRVPLGSTQETGRTASLLPHPAPALRTWLPSHGFWVRACSAQAST